VRWVRVNKPDAPIPPLFADEALFEDARRLLEQLGEDKFFAPMNPAAVDARWGRRAAAGLWTQERFAEASTSSDPDARAKLFDALARTHFKAFAQQRDQFVDVDSGLATLGRHAKSLGYDAVILLLDELVARRSRNGGREGRAMGGAPPSARVSKPTGFERTVTLQIR
jgi:hypothetical protein